MFDLRLEKAQARHTDDIWKILKAAFAAKPHSPYIATGQPGYKTYLQDRLTQRAQDDSRQLLVATIKDRLAAFADVTLNEDRANFLTRIAVSQTFRGQGMARVMMQRIQDIYQLENDWELDVLSTNRGALKLYKSLGFRTVSRRKWLGKMLNHNNNGAETYEMAHEYSDSSYKRYGFTTITFKGHSIAVAGSAIRCSDADAFLNNDLLSNVREYFPQTDRAFTILEATDVTVDHLPEVFEIVRSERMTGTF